MSDDYVENDEYDEEDELEYDEDEDEVSNDIEDLELVDDGETSVFDGSHFYNKNDYETISKLEAELELTEGETHNKITKYEYATVIGYRAQELANGAPSFIDTKGMTDVIDIAEEEYKQDKIALIIKRPMPNGEYKYYRVDRLRR